MSSISSLASALSSSLLSSTQRSQRSDSTKKFDDLFAQLDTTSKGYLTESDLQTALAQVSNTTATSTSASSTSSSASADEIFTKLDSNGDGKVTQDELSSGMEKLSEALDSQFNQMRMGGGMPPPPSNDTGFTKDQLTSQLSAIGSTDSARSELMTKIVNNFTAADTNGDGKVSFQEAMTYDQQNPTTASSSTSSSSSLTSSSAASTTSSTSSTSSTSEDLAIMKRLMELMQTYASNDAGASSLLSTLSVLA